MSHTLSVNNIRYSTKESKTLGTFFHNLPYYNFPDNFDFDAINIKNSGFNISEYKEHRIDKLSEEDKVNNWQIVLPEFILRNREIKKDFWENNKYVSKDINVKKRQDVLSFLKVNLSQLPNYLWNRIKYKYKDGKFSHYYVKDKIYKYTIVPTLVDEEIKELKKLITLRGRSKKGHLRMVELVHNIKKANIDNGWVLLKAEHMIK